MTQRAMRLWDRVESYSSDSELWEDWDRVESCGHDTAMRGLRQSAKLESWLTQH